MSRDLTLFDTLTRQEIAVGRKDPLLFYTCGPTVYNVAHIGNLRSYIFADSVRRAAEYGGTPVRWVMNLTDVDDKTIRDTLARFGREAGATELRDFTGGFIAAFRKDLALLLIPEDRIEFVRVSDVIPAIAEFIRELTGKGYAYAAEDGSVYFSIDKYQKDFGDYGELVGQGFLTGKKTGARVKVDEYDKDNLSDFVLWKARDPEDGGVFWEAPGLLPGRPGWHVECSVINRLKFGGPTDIHSGGVDLIFPHHTNEIAQSQPFYRPFVRHWFHSEHLLVDNRKMAKSENNFFTLADIAARGFDPLAFRYLILSAHYRTRQNFTWESMAAAAEALNSLRAELYRRLYVLRDGEIPSGGELSEAARDLERRFGEALRDDLNTPRALAVLQETLGPSPLSPREAVYLARMFDAALGLGLSALRAEVPENVAKLAADREEARRNKQFIQSDALRAEIKRLGYIVEDTPDGPILRPNDQGTA